MPRSPTPPRSSPEPARFGPACAQAAEYLEKYAGFLTAESATKLLADLEPFKLTTRERLQLLNLAPTSAIDVHLVRTLCPPPPAPPCGRTTGPPQYM